MMYLPELRFSDCLYKDGAAQGSGKTETAVSASTVHICKLSIILGDDTQPNLTFYIS